MTRSSHRLLPQVLAAPVVVIGFLLGHSMAVIASDCKPLIVFYNGFNDQDDNARLWRTCNDYSPPRGARKECRSWSKFYGGYETDFIKDHWNSTNSETPIILIGYSYGGDTAYDIADRLPRKYQPTLITLDPVGKKGYRDDLPKPTEGIWLNIYTKPRPFSFDWLGIGWRHQDNADINIKFPGKHHEAQKMFDLAKPTIDDTISCLK